MNLQVLQNDIDKAILKRVQKKLDGLVVSLPNKTTHTHKTIKLELCGKDFMVDVDTGKMFMWMFTLNKKGEYKIFDGSTAVAITVTKNTLQQLNKDFDTRAIEFVSDNTYTSNVAIKIKEVGQQTLECV